MKTKIGHLIGCVAEESGEVSIESNKITKTIGKMIRFGIYDHHPKKSINNLKQLQMEMYDLVGAYQALMEELNEDPAINWDKVQAKKEKIKFYMGYSQEAGHLEIKE
jgi:NTP pyrophosphatase (non-canonical NTP hydrolase)